MRSRRFGAFLLAASIGCAHPVPAPPGPAIGERFNLRPGETAAIAGTPVKITFERIVSDSRCAVDVVCIQAGEARASFRLDAGPGRTETFTLDTDRNATAVVAGYRISLLSVSPAPRSTVRIDPRNYSVEVMVVRERNGQKGNSPPS